MDRPAAEALPPVRSVPRRRRKKGHRPHKVLVEFSTDELQMAEAIATAERLALGAWIAKAAVTPPRLEATADKELRARLLVELMGLQRQLVGACTNLNQIAAGYNSTGDVAGEAPVVADFLRRTATRIDQAIASVARERT